METTMAAIQLATPARTVCALADILFDKSAPIYSLISSLFSIGQSWTPFDRLFVPKSWNSKYQQSRHDDTDSVQIQ